MSSGFRCQNNKWGIWHLQEYFVQSQLSYDFKLYAFVEALRQRVGPNHWGIVFLKLHQFFTENSQIFWSVLSRGLFLMCNIFRGTFLSFLWIDSRLSGSSMFSSVLSHQFVLSCQSVFYFVIGDCLLSFCQMAHAFVSWAPVSCLSVAVFPDPHLPDRLVPKWKCSSIVLELLLEFVYDSACYSLSSLSAVLVGFARPVGQTAYRPLL